MNTFSTSSIIRFSTVAGTSSKRGVIDLKSPCSVYSTSYKAGQYVPGIWATLRKKPSLPPGEAFGFSALNKSMNSSPHSSDSPRDTISKKSAIGSTLYAQGPPHTSSGKSKSRSLAYIGMPAKSSIFKMLVKLISY